MNKRFNNQCVSSTCKYKIANNTWSKIFRKKKPLCKRINEITKSLPVEFPKITTAQKEIFNNHFRTYNFPKSSENGLVIVETREDDRLDFVIKNIAYYVPNWTLHIFHGKDNKAFIENILKDKKTNVHLHLLNQEIKSNQDYNNVMKDMSFWQTLTNHKRVLIFQTDTIMLRDGINDFLHFDYIGAVWPWWGKFYDLNRVGGNGGFSLRKVSTMIRLLKEYGHLKTAPIRNYQNEDIFFSYHLYLEDTAQLPSWNKAMFFSSENALCTKTMAIHQAWKFYPDYKPEFQIMKR